MSKITVFSVGVMGNNAYLVENEDNREAVVIDPSRSYNKISTYAKENGLRITAGLITHGHFDHIWEAAAFQNDGAKLFIHESDADKLYTDKNLCYMVSPRGNIIKPCKADEFIKDGDVIDVSGLKFRVIHTPGHSPGSVCFLHNDFLFSGDTIFSDSVGRTDFPDSVPSDLSTSVEKLIALDKNYLVYPGHGNYTYLNEFRKLYSAGLLPI